MKSLENPSAAYKVTLTTVGIPSAAYKVTLTTIGIPSATYKVALTTVGIPSAAYKAISTTVRTTSAVAGAFISKRIKLMLSNSHSFYESDKHMTPYDTKLFKI